MKGPLKRLRKENGQAVALFGVLLVVMLGMAALVVDLGVRFVAKRKVQNAADAAAMAGAYELPNAASAASKAKQYAKDNGISEGHVQISVPYSGDANKIEVICSADVSFTFARIFGYEGTTVSGRAVAARSGMGGAFGYAVFSGDPNYELPFYGSFSVIHGGVHSNGHFTINGNNVTIEGCAEAGGRFTMNGSNEVIQGPCQGSPLTIRGQNNNVPNQIPSGASYIDMPDFTDLIKQEAQASGKVYNSSQTFNGCNVDVSHSMYINGDLTVNGDRFSGNGAILVKGNITFNGSNISSSGNEVCFYTQNGSIINGDRPTLDGILYAPNGSIIFNASGVTVNGRVIGKKVIFNGEKYTVSPGGQEFKYVSGGGVKLVE